jgi:hypothetical protein
MTKLCDRNYSDGSMLTAKLVNDVPTCPSCGKATGYHRKPIETRALFWALSDDTGISSEAIARHMTGDATRRMSPPSDSHDRGRCIRLLEIIPEWIPRLNEMVQYDAQKTEGIVINSSGISAYDNSWAKQIPLILQEGNL